MEKDYYIVKWEFKEGEYCTNITRASDVEEIRNYYERTGKKAIISKATEIELAAALEDNTPFIELLNGDEILLSEGPGEHEE